MIKLTIEDIEIEVAKKNIKTIRLSVHPPNGQVKISAPNRMTDESIRLFIISRLAWIKKQQLKFENQEKIPELEYVSGEEHYYFGQRYLLNVITEDINKAKVEIRSNKFIDLYVREGSDKGKRAATMKEWYRKELKSLIPSMIEKWENIMGLKINEWGVKQMKTRWGTCNINAKRIWLNLELAKKPYHCLEYIIVHEIAHLIERGHGPKFKAIMDEYYPNWRNVKAELNGMIFQD
ncbi:SprT family zinc-dependent metalloprotease [Tissierella sp.]|uniref:M48 family metallopeptidase n=1 Tax=Tissierella sp. TaxID=41274 RepID=UPI00285475B7|nr:SprT family zinc-dependent metalloprotease [Tissierella sp.]MDR7855412.1 SprT family zinc-dependent metalloprotease [Tissierella sp.]